MMGTAGAWLEIAIGLWFIYGGIARLKGWPQ
jgi:hypothetical protein